MTKSREGRGRAWASSLNLGTMSTGGDHFGRSDMSLSMAEGEARISSHTPVSCPRSVAMNWTISSGSPKDRRSPVLAFERDGGRSFVRRQAAIATADESLRCGLSIGSLHAHTPPGNARK